jgi:hypothetical protein
VSRRYALHFFTWLIWIKYFLRLLVAGSVTPCCELCVQVLDDVPGIGRVAKAAPEYDGPTFSEFLSHPRLHALRTVFVVET